MIKTYLIPLLAAPLAALAGQHPAGPLWESYRRGAEVLRAAAVAHGGGDRILRLGAVSYTWDGREYAPAQNRIPVANPADTTGNGRPVMYQYSVDFAHQRFEFNGAFAFAGGFTDVDAPGRPPVNIHMASDGKRFINYDPHDVGSAYAVDTSGTATRANQNAFVNMAPLVLLRRAFGSLLSARYLGSIEHDGHAEDAVQFIEGDDRPRALYFDRGTHLLTRMEMIGDGGSFGDEIDAVHYLDYETIDGLPVPKHAEQVWNGVLYGRYTRTGFSVDQPLPDTIMTIPSGFAAPVPAAGPRALAMRKLGDGVYVVENIGGSYRSLVVDTDEGVVVVEAPVNLASGEAAAALIEQTLPGHPIRYVVVTHHHADHRGGLRAYASRGVSILVAPSSADYIRQRLSDPHTLTRIVMPPPETGARLVVPSPGRRTIGHGERSVEIIDVSPTSHASAMLVAYVPSRKILFTGDLLDIDHAGRPSLSARELGGIIRKFDLDVETIVSVHGPNAAGAELDAALARHQTPDSRR